ncbi:MAG TPA: hypothetical protein VMR37_03115 [Rhabdochlamydiaceae bacterium]|nr:hypothetical protein [Rhabdochlamydiaceae bacterium]
MTEEVVSEVCMKNDPLEMKKSKEASWLCDLFQSYKLTAAEKKAVILAVTREFKMKELLSGQGD